MAILAAIDENERSRAVVEIAADLATTYDDTLVALHVVPQENFESHRESIESLPRFQGFSVSQEKDSAKRFAKEFVLDTIDDIDLQRVEARGRVGDVTDEILAEASSLEPRFLVISGRRRSPTGKAVFGNTAQRILLNANCPVVTQLSDT
jgi:nucleotide-binding universal stress UspA family protein